MPMWRKTKAPEPVETRQQPHVQALISSEYTNRLPPCDNQRILKEWAGSKRSERTKASYRADIQRFLAFIEQKPLNYVALQDVLDYRAHVLAGQKITSQNRRLSAIKSLLSFACRLYPGFFPVNVGSALPLERVPDTLSQRILEERQVLRMQEAVWLAKDERYRQRNYVILRLLYGAAIRRAELCGLRWRDTLAREDGSGQITVFGKGGKTRTILLPAPIWKDLADYRQSASDDTPVFASQKRDKNGEKALGGAEVWRIVRHAAELAGLEQPVSPHWMRHAHASHALDNGAPVTLVRDTGGWADLRTLSRYAHARPKASSGQFLKV